MTKSVVISQFLLSVILGKMGFDKSLANYVKVRATGLKETHTLSVNCVRFEVLVA